MKRSPSLFFASALGGGRRIAVGRGFDTATLQQVVTALEGI
jgi:hypothetical protein